MNPAITPIVMPKWGLSMAEGTVVSWLVDEGALISVGLPILEVESDKIANAVEAPDPGLLRRKLAAAGELLPVKALLGVMAPLEVTDAEIDAYIAAFVVPAASAGDDAEAASAYQWLVVDGIRVRYARRGGDDSRHLAPVLFLHGFGGDLDNWLFNLDAVAAHSSVIAIDLPGHGQSGVQMPTAVSSAQVRADETQAGQTLSRFAAFVLHLLDQIDVERVHAVGHSMGGAIAAQMALTAPDRVASLVLIAPAGLGAEINTAYLSGFVAASSRRELKPVVEQLFAEPNLVSRQLLDDLLKYKRLDGVSALLTQLGADLFGGGTQTALPVAQLAGSAIPTTLIWGREDRIIPAAQAAAAGSSASVHVLDGAGHMVMMEKASEVNALIAAQLRSTW
jgi:pyruvate dehydrogenase E2 component (dihydrolipoamide acetyltransferase)